jgi:uncharacterized protein YdaU (DUF1376 family)
MTSKVRRVDWYPDEYIGGTFGRLTVEEHGLYGVVLNMIYSSGGPVDADWLRLARACCSRPHAMQRIARQLIAKGKLRFTADGRLTNGRADLELGRAAERIEDARRAGQASGVVRRNRVGAHPAIIRRSPADKTDDPRKRSLRNNGVGGTAVRNYQPPTIMTDRESITDAARDPAPDRAAPGRAPTKPDPRLDAAARKARAKLMRGE